VEGLGIDEDAVEVEDDRSHGVDGTPNPQTCPYAGREGGRYTRRIWARVV
jgi:hypothetical protein